MPADWHKAKSIFNSVLEIPLAERAKYLAEACAEDDSLRRYVEDLLSSYKTDFLEPIALSETEVLKPGNKIGRYEVNRLLGVGGMGQVYLARDESLDRLACVKVLSYDMTAGRMHLDRFVREAQSASALNNPHICTIYEISKENDPPFIAMEYIEGRTVADMIAAGELDPERVIDIALQIADGLADAHSSGIVHRDIKPANIIVNKRGQAKILDFGLAKKVVADLEGTTQPQLSVSGIIMGTVSYMSPEQVKGEPVDARSDIFSFGVLLYEMISGRRPFDSDNMAETMALILTAAPKPLTSTAPDLDGLIKKCLEKDKGRRWQSMHDVAAQLQNLTRQDVNFSAAGPREPPAQTPTPRTAEASARSLYLRGRVKAASEHRDEIEGAIKLLEDAVAIDPNYAEAHAALARAYTAKAFQFATETEKKQVLEDAEVAVETALSLDSDLAEGHFARGVVLWTHAKRFPHEQAIQAYQRAIALDPNLDEAHHRLGLVYFHIGLLDEAREEVRKALEINPNNTMARFRLGTIDAHQGNFEDAIATFKMIPREVSPSIIDRARADALVNLGRLDEANALVEDYLKTYPEDEGGNVTSVKALLLAKAGESAEAEAMILRAIEIGRGFGHFHHTTVNIAAAYSILNKPEEAVRWLRDAADDGFPCYPYFEVNPNFDGIRCDIGFIALMSELRDAYQKRLSEIVTRPQTKRAASATRTLFERWRGRWNRVAIIAVLVTLAGALAAGWIYTRRSATPIDALAVMPLVNEIGNTESEYLSDGITESLIGRLSQIPNLSVKARSSVFRFKGKDVPLKEIGKELNVPAILTGRMIRHEKEFNVYVELVDAATESVIWRSEYNRPESALATISGEIARDVADGLHQRLSRVDEQKVARNYTQNSAAYELYLKGRYYWDKRNEESYKVAEDAYDQAISLDPNYALAYAGLADCYLFREIGLGRDVAMPKAKEYALKALQIDESLAEAHTTLAFVNSNYDLDFSSGEKEFQRAIDLKPNYAIAHQFYGALLVATGRTDEALAEMRKAVELEPYAAAINWSLGMGLGSARRYDEAISQLQKTLQLQPGYALAEGNLIGMFIQTARYDEAMALVQKHLAIPERRDGALSNLAIIYAKTGRKTEARDTLATLFRESGSQNNPYSIAKVYAALGDKDRAIDWLNKAVERRSFSVWFLRGDPFFDDLHDNPRFDELLVRIGFK